jgi:hypothetical protein
MRQRLMAPAQISAFLSIILFSLNPELGARSVVSTRFNHNLEDTLECPEKREDSL